MQKNKRLICILSTILLPVLLICCSGEEDQEIITAETPTVDPEVALLQEIVNLGAAFSINKDKRNWELITLEVRQELRDLNFEEAVRHFLRGLGDDHSSYFIGNRVLSESTVFCQSANFDLGDIPVGIGYLKVSSFSGFEAEAIDFANNLRDEIARQEQIGVTSWIVDLSNNTGGNMWPMVAGVGPFLGEDVLGSFLDSDGQESFWRYKDGKSFLDDEEFATVSESYELINPDTKIAVIIDGGTASSGEAVAIAFKGRPNTQFFGTPTCGLSTANAPFDFSNGDLLNMTTAYMVDRTGKKYGQTVEPDEEIENNEDLRTRVIEWLQE